MKRRLIFSLVLICIAAVLVGARQSSEQAAASTIECVSVGEANRGFLINGVPFPAGEGYLVRSLDRTYATPELIGAVRGAVRRVRSRYPETADLVIGDLSWPKGGRMREHRSHTNGRDVDLGLYAKDNRQLYHFESMGAQNLDVPKSWLLIESLLAGDKVELIFMDTPLQAIFYTYAKTFRHYSDEQLAALFQYPRSRGTHAGVIRWAKGHRDHVHVRFHSPRAVEAAAKYTYAELRRMRSIQPRHGFVAVREGTPEVEEGIYVVGEGDSLWRIAGTYGVSVRELRSLNKLDQSSTIRPGQTLRYRAAAVQRFSPIRAAELPLIGRDSVVQLRHDVAETDTLASVSAEYNVPADQIRVWNWMEPTEPISDRNQLVLYLPGSRLQSVAEPRGLQIAADGFGTEGLYEIPGRPGGHLPLSSFAAFVVSIRPRPEP